MDRSLRIEFISGEAERYNNRAVKNYDELYSWLTNNSDVPFVINKEDGKKIILFKHSIKNVEVFRTV